MLLFIGLFSNASSTAEVALNNRMNLCDKLGRTWKESVLAYLNTLHQHMPGGTEGNDSLSHGLHFEMETQDISMLTSTL
jgi:hypothetical protein